MVSREAKDSLAFGGLTVKVISPEDPGPITDLGDYTAIALRPGKPLPQHAWLSSLLTAHAKRRREISGATGRHPLWSRFIVLSPPSPVDPELSALIGAVRETVPVEVSSTDELSSELDRTRKPDAAEREGEFLRRVWMKLTRWMWPTPDTASAFAARAAAGSDNPIVRIQSTRMRLISRLRRVVAEAAADEQPPREVSVVGWTQQVFATFCTLKGYFVLFQEGMKSEYVTVKGDSADRPLLVALPPGLLVAILVEAWSWVLGQGDDTPADKKDPLPTRPLCEISTDTTTAQVRLEFTPLCGAGFHPNSPRAPTRDEFLRFLTDLGYTTHSPGDPSFVLSLPMTHQSSAIFSPPAC